MIKETSVKKRCSVIGKEVRLAVCCYEDYRTGLKTPQTVEGCDSPEQCRIKSGKRVDWFRCPYFGKKT